MVATDRAGNESAASLKIFCAPTPVFDATLNGGVIKFLGGEVDAASPGLLGAGRLVYNLNQHWGLGVTVGYGQSGVNPMEQESNTDQYTTTAVPAAALGRYMILPEAKISPYATLEAGAVFWQNKLAETTKPAEPHCSEPWDPG